MHEIVENNEWRRNSSARRLPDWAYGILLWSMWIGAPFSFVCGLVTGTARCIMNGVGGSSSGNNIYVWITIYGVVGMVLGTMVLAIGAFVGWGMLAFLRLGLGRLLSALTPSRWSD
jgi:hypothetical protein